MTVYPTKDRPPTEDEVLAYFESLSNWGRWGDDDERGTLNHVTPETRKRAAAAVQHGISVSCAWELDVGPGSLERHTMAFRTASELAGTENAIPGEEHRAGAPRESTCALRSTACSTPTSTLCATFSGTARCTTAGRPSWSPPSEGATACAVTSAAAGMLTRGVLFDIPALRGVPWLEPGEPVYPDDLEAAEERQGVRVEPGDAVLLRTGAGRLRHESIGGSDDPTHGMRSGWHASCLPWFADRQVAYIGCDTANDTMPSGYPGIFMPVHAVSLTAMGLWLLDNCDLESCAAAADELRQWDFLLSVCPLRMTGVSGSPVNPIATF